MILSSTVTENDVEEMLIFYKAHFQQIDLVKCESCGAYLCFELALPYGDSMGLNPNELGKYVVPIGDALSSSRIRLDETPDGERMQGYQCSNLISNPNYVVAEEKWKKEYNDTLKDHDKATKQYEKDYAKLVKKIGPGEPMPEKNPPQFVEPTPHDVPEFIECGNDTRLGFVERGLVPTGTSLVHLSPFEKSKIVDKIRSNKIKPDFKKLGNKKHFETFSVERLS